MSKRFNRMLFATLYLILGSLVLVARCDASMSGSSESGVEESDGTKKLYIYNRIREGYCDYLQETAGKVLMEEYNTEVVCSQANASDTYAKVISEKDNPVASVVVTDEMVSVAGMKAGLWSE